MVRGIRSRRNAAAAAALTAACGLFAAPAAVAAPAESPDCRPWKVRTVVSGQGWLEDALMEPSGSLLVTRLDTGRLLRVTPSGGVTTVAADLPTAGGLARRGGDVFVTTGDSPVSAVLGTPDGTIERLDPRTGRHTTWARDLVMPNGLVMLPDGSAVTTRPLDLGVGVSSRVTLVPARDRAHPQYTWSDIESTNGAVLDPSGRWVYLSTSLAPRSEIWRVRVSNPADGAKVADLGASAGIALDDITITPDLNLYAAGWISGAVYQVDSRTGASCVIASGLQLPTAVEPAPGPRPDKLYVTSSAGPLYELTRP